MEKYCRAGPATDDSTAHGHCILDTQGYKYVPRICNASFPQQQWLHERASLLCYTYIACPVIDLTHLFCSDGLLWTVTGVTLCGLVVVCFVGAKSVSKRIFFYQGINSVLRGVLTLLHCTLYLINVVLLIHRPFRAASGIRAIAAVQYAVSRGPRVVVQCIAVTTNFLRTVFE